MLVNIERKFEIHDAGTLERSLNLRPSDATIVRSQTPLQVGGILHDEQVGDVGAFYPAAFTRKKIYGLIKTEESEHENLSRLTRGHKVDSATQHLAALSLSYYDHQLPRKTSFDLILLTTSQNQSELHLQIQKQAKQHLDSLHSAVVNGYGFQGLYEIWRNTKRLAVQQRSRAKKEAHTRLLTP
jgi:hypothetical protein